MMTHDEMIAVIQAHQQGRQLQYDTRGEWFDVQGDPIFNFAAHDYRIKPEPKLRPWKAEEGVGKIVRSKKKGNIGLILGWNNEEKMFINPREFGSIDKLQSPQYLLETCVQLDGSPCGVEE